MACMKLIVLFLHWIKIKSLIWQTSALIIWVLMWGKYVWYLCGHFRITIFYFSFLVFPLLIFYIYPVGYCCMFFRFNFSFCVFMFHIDIHIDNTYLYLYNIFSMLYIYIVHVIFYILCDTYMCMYILYIDVKCLSLVVV